MLVVPLLVELVKRKTFPSCLGANEGELLQNDATREAIKDSNWAPQGHEIVKLIEYFNKV